MQDWFHNNEKTTHIHIHRVLLYWVYCCFITGCTYITGAFSIMSQRYEKQSAFLIIICMYEYFLYRFR